MLGITCVIVLYYTDFSPAKLGGGGGGKMTIIF